MRRAVLPLLLALLLTGCGSDEPAGPPGPEAAPSSPEPTASPSFAVLDGPLRRCGPQPAALE